MKSDQRIHKVDPITVNEIKIFQVVIDAHYEEKHHSYMSDALILNLAKELDGRQELPETKTDRYSYFATLIEFKELKMGFPSQKELKSIRAKLAKAEPPRLLPKNASKADQLKYKLCEKFVIYLRENDISQAHLARKLKVDPSRINEIIKYRIDLYTVDKLMDLAEKLDLDFDVNVA